MDLLIGLVLQYGALVVFATVLVEQLGVPIPAYPVLMLAGGSAARGDQSVALLLGAAVVACLIADSAWYAAGSKYGRRVLGVLCRVSLTPDSCVRQTESVFHRWGATSLLVAKFVPGFASVATALAGAMRVPRGSFLLFDALGASLWAGLGIGLGVLFADAIEDLLRTLSELGRWGLGVLGFVVAIFLLRKWWQRHRFGRQLDMERMTVSDLSELMEGEEKPLILDVRAPQGWAEGRIPGALATGVQDTWPDPLREHPKESLVVVYCACPNDASAVIVARKLLKQGFKEVRPLAGGIDAWVAAGRALES